MVDRDRDDVAVNDILSQLSQDETVIGEVRKIVLRSLKAQGSTPNGDTQQQRTPPTSRPASQEVDKGSNSDNKRGEDSSEEQSSSSISAKNNTFRHGQKEKAATVQRATIAVYDEELAFTVSKESDTYRNILSTVQWYRDSFLIGSSFADRRNAERKVVHNHNDVKVDSSGEKLLHHHQSIMDQGVIIPKSDPSTATGHPLLLSAFENYVRSTYAVDLLRPYATWVGSKDGPMFVTATRSMASTIPLGQSSCDWATRENLLWVLKDEEWKEFAKSITTTYVDRSYKDG